MKFYEIRQNNSGGYFITDNDHGIGEDMIIQANSAKEATGIFEKIGDAFDGFYNCCQCCGDRWYTDLEESDGKDSPMIYGKQIEGMDISIWKAGRFVHYLDGRIVEYIGDGDTVTRQKLTA